MTCRIGAHDETAVGDEQCISYSQTECSPHSNLAVGSGNTGGTI